MGAVYLAVDEALVCEVALKQIVVPGDALEKLRDEVRLAQKVTHPNVCRTYDLHEVNSNWLVSGDGPLNDRRHTVLVPSPHVPDSRFSTARASTTG